MGSHESAKLNMARRRMRRLRANFLLDCLPSLGKIEFRALAKKLCSRLCPLQLLPVLMVLVVAAVTGSKGLRECSSTSDRAVRTSLWAAAAATAVGVVVKFGMCTRNRHILRLVPTTTTAGRAYCMSRVRPK